MRNSALINIIERVFISIAELLIKGEEVADLDQTSWATKSLISWPMKPRYPPL